MDIRIEAALAAVERHLDAVSIAKLAATVNLSPSRFAHLFRQEVGTAPARYIHTLRMLRARTLLEQTFLSVKEVMARVGCNDPSHFSHHFRRFHGVAPRSCRRRVDTFQEPAAASDIATLANERLTTRRQPAPCARAPDASPSSRCLHVGILPSCASAWQGDPLSRLRDRRVRSSVAHSLTDRI